MPFACWTSGAGTNQSDIEAEMILGQDRCFPFWQTEDDPVLVTLSLLISLELLPLLLSSPKSPRTEHDCCNMAQWRSQSLLTVPKEPAPKESKLCIMHVKALDSFGCSLLISTATDYLHVDCRTTIQSSEGFASSLLMCCRTKILDKHILGPHERVTQSSKLGQALSPLRKLNRRVFLAFLEDFTVFVFKSATAFLAPRQAVWLRCALWCARYRHGHFGYLPFSRVSRVILLYDYSTSIIRWAPQEVLIKLFKFIDAIIFHRDHRILVLLLVSRSINSH